MKFWKCIGRCRYTQTVFTETVFPKCSWANLVITIIESRRCLLQCNLRDPRSRALNIGLHPCPLHKGITPDSLNILMMGVDDEIPKVLASVCEGNIVSKQWDYFPTQTTYAYSLWVSWTGTLTGLTQSPTLGAQQHNTSAPIHASAAVLPSPWPTSAALVDNAGGSTAPFRSTTLVNGDDLTTDTTQEDIQMTPTPLLQTAYHV